MPSKQDVDELELSDAELVTVLRNHGIDRRALLTALGAGGAVAAFGGLAAGGDDEDDGDDERGGGGGRDARIDEVFGAAYAADESPPPGLVDHEVVLRGPPESDGGVHEDFPMVDSPEDGDFLPDSEAAEFYFDPVGLHVEPGDVVNFPVEEAHVHTVTAFQSKYEGLPDRIPEKATGFTSPPIAGEETWLYRFEETGVYDVACLPHVGLGMVARVVVFDENRDDEDDLTDWGDLPNPPGPTDPFENAEEVLTENDLDPEEILAEGEVPWAALELG